MSKIQEFFNNAEPYIVLMLSFFAIWKVFAPQVVTYQLFYMLSNIALAVIGIPHMVLLFQGKGKQILSILYSVALLSSLIVEWI